MRALSRRNLPLLSGGIIVAVFLILAVVGPFLTSHDPIEDNRTLRIDGEWVTAPFRPGEIDGFILGSDEIGRDILTRILWGIRPTLILCLLVVSVRLVLGLVLGLLAGWYGGRFERIVDSMVGASLSIPLLVFAIAAISYIGQDTGLIAFVFGLAITGWAETAAFVKQRTTAIVQAPYIEGAQAIGASPGRVLFKHVLPQLWPVLPSLVAFELASVMLIVAELGFLGIFIGGGITYDSPMPDSSGVFQIRTAGAPELGQLLSDFWSKIILTPWVPFLVGTIVFLQIFGFNLLGEGLRRHMDVTRTRPGVKRS